MWVWRGAGGGLGKNISFGCGGELDVWVFKLRCNVADAEARVFEFTYREQSMPDLEKDGARSASPPA